MKKILKNLLVIIGIIIYFMTLVFAYTRMNPERLANDIKVFASVLLIIGMLVIEKAYKRDSGKMAITGIELLVLSFHSLSIMHMVNIFKCDFHFYLIISSVVVIGYYMLKGIVTYTKERREYLKGLSDISEIVKEDEPIKKEAKKRSVQKEIVEDKVISNKTSSTDSKKSGTKKTAKPENNEEKVQTKRKTKKKNTKVEETKTEGKTETAKPKTTIKKKEVELTTKTPKKKKSSITSTTDKKTTKKSEKEVKEND